MNRPAVPEWAQSATRRGAFVAQRATASARVLPDFLICGAQRSGTTSTYKMLSSHPQVVPAVLRKGVHYFDTGYHHDVSWYRAHFPLAATMRRVARRTGRAITGESSPYYLFHPLAAQRIGRDLPDVRILVLLRDPVERAVSAHAHELARGWEDLALAPALEREKERTAGEAQRLSADPAAWSRSHQHQAYVARGEYVDQLERLEGVVGRERMHVVDADDLFRDPAPALAAICTFLGLEPHPDAGAFRQHNARSRSAMDEDLRRRLTAHFEPYDRRLETWWGRTPSWRR